MRSGRGAHLDAPFDEYPLEQACRDQQRSGGDEEDDSRVCDRDEHTGHERTEQRAETLECRGGTVGGDQLFRSPGKRRQGRLESGPEECRRDADDARERKHDQLAAAEEEGRGRAAESSRPGKRDCDEEPLSSEAVTQGRREGREKGRRQHPDEPGDADRRRAAR